MNVTLYGLKNCDTCNKAIKALKAAGRSVTFVDIRTDADLAAKVPEWLDTADGAKLLNTRSTTWRGLSDADKALAETNPAQLLIANPTLIKRPVIEAGDSVSVGWTKSEQAALGA